MRTFPLNIQSPAPLQTPPSFESAFQRLEEILERMNGNAVSLDESLKLYEEADSLINICSQRLNDAERKISILMKNRNGDLIEGSNGQPLTEEFRP